VGLADLKRGEDETQAIALANAEYALKMLEFNKKRQVMDRDIKAMEKEKIDIELMQFDNRIREIDEMIAAKKLEIEGIKSRMYLDGQKKG